MNGTIGAFVATSRPEHARAFYRDTLGLKLVSEDPFALVFDGGGTVLRVPEGPVVGRLLTTARVRNGRTESLALERALMSRRTPSQEP